ncbi:hypothetical protein BT93_F1404 [Corymbia citriodora subsp. variegata]|nr:hypothetical protein BT93_F1404 [Corymbia citriodora subsp. variegata]
MAGRGQVISCHTEQELQGGIQGGIKSKKLVVVAFVALLNPPVLDDLAKELTNVIFLKVDVTELKSVAHNWGVENIPTFFVLKKGTPAAKTLGENKEDLLMKIAKLATATDNLNLLET